MFEICALGKTPCNSKIIIETIITTSISESFGEMDSFYPRQAIAAFADLFTYLFLLEMVAILQTTSPWATYSTEHLDFPLNIYNIYIYNIYIS